MGDLTTHFSRHEFACSCGCGMDSIDYSTLVALEEIRDEFSSPIQITSAHRCKDNNDDVGGSLNSQHRHGRAVDFTVMGVSPVELQAYLKYRYPDIYGIGSYEDFTHLDTRSGSAARWNG